MLELEGWKIQLSRDLELIRQKIRNLSFDERKHLCVALQYDEDERIKKIFEKQIWTSDKTLVYTKEMWPLVCGVSRSNKVCLSKRWIYIPIYVIK